MVEDDELAIGDHVEFISTPRYPCTEGHEFGSTGYVREITKFGSLRITWDEGTKAHRYDIYGYNPGRFKKVDGPW